MRTPSLMSSSGSWRSKASARWPPGGTGCRRRRTGWRGCGRSPHRPPAAFRRRSCPGYRSWQQPEQRVPQELDALRKDQKRARERPGVHHAEGQGNERARRARSGRCPANAIRAGAACRFLAQREAEVGQRRKRAHQHDDDIEKRSSPVSPVWGDTTAGLSVPMAASDCGMSVPVMAPPTTTAAPTPTSKAVEKAAQARRPADLQQKENRQQRRDNSVSTADGRISPAEPCLQDRLTSPGHSTATRASARRRSPAATPMNRWEAMRKSGLSPIRYASTMIVSSVATTGPMQRVDQGGDLAHGRLPRLRPQGADQPGAEAVHAAPGASTRAPGSRLNGFQQPQAGPARPLRSS